MLTIQIHPEPKLRINGAIPLFSPILLHATRREKVLYFYSDKTYVSLKIYNIIKILMKWKISMMYPIAVLSSGPEELSYPKLSYLR